MNYNNYLYQLFFFICFCFIFVLFYYSLYYYSNLDIYKKLVIFFFSYTYFISENYRLIIN